MDLYIYYKVPCATREATLRVVAAIQADVSRFSGSRAELRRRPQADATGIETWMEVYRDAPDGLETYLTELVALHGLADLIAGARHTEHFVALDTVP